MKREINSLLAIIFLLILACFISGYFIFLSKSISFPSWPSLISITKPPFISESKEFKEMKKFASLEDFKSYLAKTETGYTLGFGARMIRALPMVEGLPIKAEKLVPERISETTVQVPGIDEPDIVKTDGQEIYFSPSGEYYWRRFLFGEIIRPKITGETKVIKAFPPENLNLEARIEQKGDLLLTKNILVIFSTDYIYGYNVSDPKTPKKEWEIKIEEKNQILSARLRQDKIYLVTKTQIDTFQPCPIRPLSVGTEPLEIKCFDIYHPTIPLPIDVTYTAMILNPRDGKIEKSVSFVGSSTDSVLYLSENALYLTYSYSGDFLNFYLKFFKEKCQDLIPTWLTEKIEKVAGYEISNQAKLIEFQVLFEKYKNSLSIDERLKIENELQNRLTDYTKINKRELEKTGLIKIDLENFVIEATGNVPGRPLNQFSLDEYQNYLRIATTIGETWRWGGPVDILPIDRETANDVYVLDKELKIIGAVYDLGLTERIYSVRFLEDKGYLVTFRQTDPFYVLDLTDPTKPSLKGELKIPGYSSYLHPITKDKILGIGKEGNQVKISLFEVSNPEKPIEIAKYNLDEYWSDILNTHHAFLLDNKHEIFFLPGSKGGYIFSYKDNKLELKKAIVGISARRAIYINDYLYIISDNKITVLNEINWEKINELEI
ncbi:MAG: beta-propeller domain-containing protein [Patescibacteria group bacterium]